MTAAEARRIAPGACSWCGHNPHPGRCRSRITTDVANRRAVVEPCPCARPQTSPNPTHVLRGPA